MLSYSYVFSLSRPKRDENIWKKKREIIRNKRIILFQFFSACLLSSLRVIKNERKESNCFFQIRRWDIRPRWFQINYRLLVNAVLHRMNAVTWHFNLALRLVQWRSSRKVSYWYIHPQAIRNIMLKQYLF